MTIDTLTQDWHLCPVKGCERRVVNSRLLCIGHWRRVSRATGAELYAAYRERPKSPRHVAAMNKAIAEAEGRTS